MVSTKQRSFVKSLTWRVLAIISGFGITYAILRDIAVATNLTIIINIVNFVLYYVHERMWLKTKWGRETK